MSTSGFVSSPREVSAGSATEAEARMLEEDEIG